MLRRKKIPMLVISRETNAVVSARCTKLGVECRHAEDDKAAALKKWAKQEGLSLNEMIFVGNDVADLGCMALVGHGVAVADAHPDVLARADRVLSRRGGRGAVRELCDLLLLANGGDV
jgi:N-acylneuraminate cytidylyltransferase